MKKALSKKNLWERILPLLKSTLRPQIGFIPTQWFLGRSFRKNCSFVRDAQWWSVERAQEYQLGKLREILKLAYKKTSFYRHLFDSVGFQLGDLRSLKDMNPLPRIDKQTSL